MAIRNFVETAVREEVARLRPQAGGVGGCWCSLCESDVLSLSLVSLPPSYGREDYPVAPRGLASPIFVRAAVERAAERVRHRPKHPPREGGYSHHQVRVVNLALEEGVTMVGEAMRSAMALCLCQRCQADILAFALNRFPVLYGVECDGLLSFPASRREFVRRELREILETAARLIGTSPRH